MERTKGKGEGVTERAFELKPNDRGKEDKSGRQGREERGGVTERAHELETSDSVRTREIEGNRGKERKRNRRQREKDHGKKKKKREIQ